jgi:hypothetical protein
VTGWDDQPVRHPRQGGGGLGRAGQRRAHGEARPLQAGPHLAQQGRLATEQVATAGDVEQQAIAAIHSGQRRPAQAPDRQALQQLGLGLGLRIRRAQHQLGADRLGVGQRLAGEDGRAIGGDQQAAVATGAPGSQGNATQGWLEPA